MTVFRNRRPGGLALVELLCVIAIIAILVALSLGPIMKAFAHAKKVVGH